MKNIFKKAQGMAAPLAFLLPALALAQPATTPTSPTSPITSITGVGSLMCTIFAWAFYFLVILAIIFVVIAAFKYLFAAGDPEKVKSAGHMVIYAVVAIAVGLIARAVPGIITSITGGSVGGAVGC